MRPSARDEGPTSKLQKRLAEVGLGSRRAMEELIQSGQVTINGRVAPLGARVGRGDRISVAGKPLAERRTNRPVREQPRVVLYHKAEGEIVSRSDPEGRPSVFDRVPIVQRGRWLAVGRLDFNTCGLLVFTDSGELANQLTHPRFEQARDYAVRIVGELTVEQTRSLRSGISLEDGPAHFDLLEPQGGEGTNRWYRVRVREGRNRLVRRMFAAIGITVSRLMRTRFGPFELPPRLKRGQWMRLDAQEVGNALGQLEAVESIPEEIQAGVTKPPRRSSDPSIPQHPPFNPSKPQRRPFDPSQLRRRPSGASNPKPRSFDSSKPQRRPFDPSKPQRRPFDPSKPQRRPFDASRSERRPFDSLKPQRRPFDPSQPRRRPSDALKSQPRSYDPSRPRRRPADASKPPRSFDASNPQRHYAGEPKARRSRSGESSGEHVQSANRPARFNRSGGARVTATDSVRERHRPRRLPRSR